jgi:hypothetical protein
VFLEKENLISHWKGDDLVAGLKGKEAGNRRRGWPRPAKTGLGSGELTGRFFLHNRGLFCPNEGLLDDEQG